jgi:hypothetical protein
MMLHVAMAEEPWPVIDCEYGAFVCAGAGVTVFITSLSYTEKLNSRFPLALASAAWIVAELTVAVLVGVPEIVPAVLFSVSPSGNCPESTDQVTAPDAPLS